MRVIEAKHILDKVVDESKQVSIKTKRGFDSTLFSVPQMDAYLDFLYLVTDLSFTDLKKEEIDELSFVKEKRNILVQEELNTLNNMVGRANSSLPVVYSAISAFAESQDENLVSIKIPEKIKTLDDLSGFNKKIENLFRKFDYGNDGNNITFSGVDKGSAWLEIIINNPSLHIDFNIALSLALQFVQAWNIYVVSKEYRLNYNIFSKRSEGDFLEKDYKEEYREKFFEAELEKEEVKGKLQLNGREEQEKISSIMRGAKGIIEILEEGSELRISYNPPEYIQENKDFFEINYSKLPKIGDSQTEEDTPRVLEDPSADISDQEVSNEL